MGWTWVQTYDDQLLCVRCASLDDVTVRWVTARRPGTRDLSDLASICAPCWELMTVALQAQLDQGRRTSIRTAFIRAPRPEVVERRGKRTNGLPAPPNVGALTKVLMAGETGTT